MANDIIGTDAGELLVGTTGDDNIWALGASDGIQVSRGHDTIDGGTGDDLLYLYSFQLGLPAGPRSYTITANHLGGVSGAVDTTFSNVERLMLMDSESAAVTIDGSAATVNLNLNLSATAAGTHSMTGGAGSDLISFGAGSGTADGGAGIDRLTLAIDTTVFTATVFAREAAGVITLSQAGRGDITGRNFESLSVSAAYGGASRVDASAMTTSVTFSQTSYADLFIGGAGNDVLTVNFTDATGTGDILTGGGGADRFVFANFAQFGGATITDFSKEDQIYLAAVVGPVSFIGTAAFTGAAGQVRYSYANGQTQLIGDMDGDGIGESVLTLSNQMMTLRETSAGSKVLQMQANVITGTNATETITGTSDDDVISALGGNDTIRVSAGHDAVDGGAGSDTLYLDASLLTLGASAHNYTITSGQLTGGGGVIDTSFTAIERIMVVDTGGSNVTLNASGLTGATLSANLLAGTHSLIGSAGADSFSIGGGSGTVDGGAGADTVAFTVDFNTNSNVLRVTQSGAATILSQAGGPSLSVTNVETIMVGARGGGANGTGLNADASASSVGVTFILGALPDRALGSTLGDIFLLSGTGTGMGDVLTGGGGADTYSYSTFSGFNGATITDFGTDDFLKFTGLPSSATFLGSAEFEGYAGQYRYVSGNGVTTLMGDTDGDGVADSFLTITNAAYVLQETSPGSGVLRVVGQMPANDTADNVVIGTDGVDYIDTGLGNDTVDGGGGDDVINGGGGDDYLLGGAGNDTIHGNAGNDTIDGGAGYDSIFGDEGDDILTATGDGGSTPFPPLYDWISGGDGNDRITATNGIFNLLGDAGDDRITLNGGRNGSWIDGGSGNDTIVANGTGAITLGGGTGDDTITLVGFVGGNVSLGPGNDMLRIVSGGGYTLDMSETFGTGHDRVVVQSLTASLSIIGFSAGEAGDVLDLSAFGADPFGTGALVFSRPNNVDSVITVAATGVRISFQNLDYHNLSAFNLGVPNPDFAPVGMTLNDPFSENPTIEWPGYLAGADGDDMINGGGGDDFLYGGGGFDTILGGNGADWIDGGSGNDVLRGEAGQDVLQGGAGDDDVSGGDGHDSVWGSDGNDLLAGDDGDDTIWGGAGIDTASYAGASSGVRVDLSWLEDQQTYGAGIDTLISIENLIGSAHDDRLTGDAGANELRGGAGDDVLIGGGGDDLLFGDVGADIFVFARGSGNDTIGDFLAGTDKIDLSDYGFASFAALEAAISDVPGSGARITLGDGSALTLSGVSRSQLGAGDFLFHAG